MAFNDHLRAGRRTRPNGVRMLHSALPSEAEQLFRATELTMGRLSWSTMMGPRSQILYGQGIMDPVISWQT